MTKSNGLRKVNKADGTKGRAKKQMAKSRRVDGKKLAKEDKSQETHLVSESEEGSVRIEGAVTPEKLVAAKEFKAIFESAQREIVELSVFVPNPNTIADIKRLGLSEDEIVTLSNAQPWTVFQYGNLSLMKTLDLKIETPQDYFFRLERAVLHHSALVKERNVQISRLNQKIEDLEEERARTLDFEYDSFLDMIWSKIKKFLS